MVLAFLLLSGSRLAAQELLAYRDSVAKAYDFLLYVPENYSDTAEAKLPLILFLHGGSLCGRNLDLVTHYGCIDALRRGLDIPALVVSPQTPTMGWDAEKVMKVVDWVGERYAYDPDRFYVIGMSMGGWGTFKVVSAYPDRVAAAVAMCGGFLGQAETLGGVPLWIIHGTQDRVTNLSHSSRIVKRMMETGTADRMRYTWLNGCDHSILARCFLLPQLYDWLFSHSLSDPDRPVNLEYGMTPADLHAAYMRLDPSGGKSLPIQKPH